MCSLVSTESSRQLKITGLVLMPSFLSWKDRRSVSLKRMMIITVTSAIIVKSRTEKRGRTRDHAITEIGAVKEADVVIMFGIVERPT